jgi:hypothetical protein
MLLPRSWLTIGLAFAAWQWAALPVVAQTAIANAPAVLPAVTPIASLDEPR